MIGLTGLLVVCCILFRLSYLLVKRRGLSTNGATVQKAVATKKKLRDQQLSRPHSTSLGKRSGLPEGQFQAKKWIVLDVGIKPNLDAYNPWRDGDNFKIKLKGVEGGSREISLLELKECGLEKIETDWHCVTGWSTLGLGFTGVRMSKFLQMVSPQKDWKCLWQVSADGYTAPILREDLEEDKEAFMAVGDGDGVVLPLEHGGIRIVPPTLYGWKSAKFLTEIHFLPYSQKGFWEKLGCHVHGRVAENERWAEEAAWIWTFLIQSADLYKVFLGPNVYFFMLWLGSTVLGWMVQFCRIFQKSTRKHA